MEANQDFELEKVKPSELKEAKSNEKDLQDSLELFGEDRDDLTNEFDYEIPISKDTTDNILKISRLIRVSVLTISGYEEQPSDEGSKTVFKLVKHPLASSEVIKHFESILKPYSDEANIITKKTWDSFKIQALADWSAFYKFCLREKASPETSERTVYRVFQGCIIDIGEITCDNPHNMDKLFGNINKQEQEEAERNIFK
jgi:hypothetical protein